MTRNSKEAGEQRVLTSDVSSSMRSSSKSKSVAAACPADDFTGAPASLQRKRREKSQFGSRIGRVLSCVQEEFGDAWVDIVEL